MQPYFFPYIGYWQLLNEVDKYVIYDDVNFIKGGWINRNRILLNGQPQYVNVQMNGASSNALINEVGRNTNKAVVDKELRKIEAAYKKAPHFEEVYQLISRILYSEETNLSKFLIESLRAVCEYLDIDTELIISSELEKDNSLHAEDKVIEICKRLEGTEYYNAIGGKELYSKENFENNGITLKFLESLPIEYPQFENEFVSSLSIIDVLMFNDVETVKSYLNQYDIK